MQLKSENDMLQKNVPLARYCTWGVGGVADYLAAPSNLCELQQLLANWDHSLPVTWLGLGSNVLIRDGGIRGLVILTRKLQEQLQLVDDGTVAVSAGVPCAKVSKFATAQHLTGAEFLAGIPGSMGGALAMNAGAFEGSTWNIVSQVQLISVHGQIKNMQANQFSVGYRQVELPADHWFVSAQLKLGRGDKETAHSKVRSIISKRSASQPIGQKSCGSVFKNPQNDHAARLIEQCDLKGTSLGGACVSSQHANFIINQGEATAADIEQLIEHVQNCVQERFGICLQPEVRIIGEVLA